MQKEALKKGKGTRSALASVCK